MSEKLMEKRYISQVNKLKTKTLIIEILIK